MKTLKNVSSNLGRFARAPLTAHEAQGPHATNAAPDLAILTTLHGPAPTMNCVVLYSINLCGCGAPARAGPCVLRVEHLSDDRRTQGPRAEAGGRVSRSICLPLSICLAERGVFVILRWFKQGAASGASDDRHGMRRSSAAAYVSAAGLQEARMARRAPPRRRRLRRRRLRLRVLSGCASVPASRKQGLGGRGLGLEEVAKLAPGKTPQG